MNSIKLSIIAASALGLGALALPGLASAGTVTLDHVAARVIVIPEERGNITAEVRAGSGKITKPTLHVTGADLTVSGDLSDRDLHDCHSTRSGAINFGFFKHYKAEDLPVITLRTPRDVTIIANGAIIGQVGAARSVDLFQKRCGAWTVAEVTGQFSLRLEGRADVTTAAVGDAKFNLDGLGDVTIASTHGLTGQLNGMGDITVGSVEGPVDITLDGMGDMRIKGGHATSFRARLDGMGDIRFAGVADTVDAATDGMGDITVAKATGSVRQSKSGFGSIKIGR